MALLDLLVFRDPRGDDPFLAADGAPLERPSQPPRLASHHLVSLAMGSHHLASHSQTPHDPATGRLVDQRWVLDAEFVADAAVAVRRSGISFKEAPHSLNRLVDGVHRRERSTRQHASMSGSTVRLAA